MSANNEVKIWEQNYLNRDTDVSKELDDYEEVIKNYKTFPNLLHQLTEERMERKIPDD